MASSSVGVVSRRLFVLWLHGLGDSGAANEPIKTYFSSPQFKNARWSFPSAPSQPVTCNCKLTLLSPFSYYMFHSSLLLLLLYLMFKRIHFVGGLDVYFSNLRIFNH